jgi:ParB family chromosome partitioning protein
MATSGDRKVERWELGRFQENPLQRLVFAEPPEHEVEELAADLRANGQTTPVEALPNGLLLAGHKRLAAAKRLGWKQLDTWVRADLANDPAAAETRLIADNLVRRQLTPLELAACYVRIRDLEKNNPGGLMLGYQGGELRDRIGKRLGISGRTLDRYLRASAAPQEVRAAVAAGQLAVTVAEQVAGLSKQQQAEIVEQLRGGGEPREVVRRFLNTAPRRAKNAIDAKDRLVKALTRAAADLDNRVEEVHRLTTADMEALRAGERLLRRLQEQGRALRAAEAAEDDLSAPEEVDPEADEAAGGLAGPSRPDNVADGRGRRPGRGGNGEARKYSAASGAGQPGDRPAQGQAAGRRTAKPSRSRPAGAKKGRARP